MEPEPLDPRPLILKKMIWDVFPHDADISDAQKRLGLSVDSADGLEIEHRASDTRLLRVEPLTQVAAILSGYIAEVMGVYLVTTLEQETGEPVETPEGFLEAFAAQNHEVLYLGSTALISHLMDVGVLEYGKKVLAGEDY